MKHDAGPRCKRSGKRRQRYPTRQTAEDVAAKLNWPAEPYWCPMCECLHLRNKKKRNNRRKKRLKTEK